MPTCHYYRPGLSPPSNPLPSLLPSERTPRRQTGTALLYFTKPPSRNSLAARAVLIPDGFRPNDFRIPIIQLVSLLFLASSHPFSPPFFFPSLSHFSPPTLRPAPPSARHSGLCRPSTPPCALTLPHCCALVGTSSSRLTIHPRAAANFVAVTQLLVFGGWLPLTTRKQKHTYIHTHTHTHTAHTPHTRVCRRTYNSHARPSHSHATQSTPIPHSTLFIRAARPHGIRCQETSSAHVSHAFRLCLGPGGTTTSRSICINRCCIATAGAPYGTATEL